MKIGYVRVSTIEQSETDALNQQTERVKRAGAILIFSDVESGRKDSRTQFNQMLELCKKGGVTEVIITRIDRLARSVITAHKTLKTFEALGIKLNILDAPIDDVSSPFGWFSASQMSQLAEFESRLLSSRIKHGMAYFREQKKAAPKPPFGFIRVNEKYAPDPENWDKAIAIINFFLTDNATLRSTANYALSEFGKKITLPGLRYWMSNPVLRGHTAYGMRENLHHPEKWEIHHNTHTPMISEATYRNIQRRLQENRTRFAYGVNKEVKEPLPLQGQLICGCCGYKCFILKRQWATYRVRCKQHDIQGNSFCANAQATYLPDIMASVDDALTKRMQEIAILATAAVENERELPEVIDLRQQLQNLKSMPENEIIKAAIAQTTTEIERLRQQQATQTAFDADLVDSLTATFADLKYWENLPNSDKRKVYLELVEKVIVANGKILTIFLRV
ncbi:fdxN element excision recombinase XisF [Calothrix sp. UHCC 0171]|uniref:fdxN element excision recombinase XisF n=1 Tax=Calothrix sp. UHCC 0171 TaxID=3110245 RepID=UPI002B1F7A95|nr:fdxN element excision recombinase XisF [Calothrix sp. UHCC 0171]MEA5573023.1 fdxN element excision recombinase XisF [Calothrix sp. UHCC 0171]